MAAIAIAAKPTTYALIAGRPLGEAMCKWDCGWYASIVERGYDAATRFVADCCWQANFVFFPLLPLLTSGLQATTGLGTALFGVLVSSACLLGFAIAGAQLRRKTRGEATPAAWLAVLLCWPFGFYFHAFYREAMFAVLATVALLGLAQGRIWPAAIATAALTAVRPTGMVLAAWIGVRQLWFAWQARGSGRRLVLLLPAAVAPLGLLLFKAFLHLRTGDALAFYHVQEG